MSTTYEVTVPLVVTVTNDKVVKATIDSGFGGFHSEAEDAGGVWNCADMQWDEEAAENEIHRVAWAWVRQRIQP